MEIEAGKDECPECRNVVRFSPSLLIKFDAAEHQNKKTLKAKKEKRLAEQKERSAEQKESQSKGNWKGMKPYKPLLWCTFFVSLLIFIIPSQVMDLTDPISEFHAVTITWFGFLCFLASGIVLFVYSLPTLPEPKYEWQKNKNKTKARVTVTEKRKKEPSSSISCPKCGCDQITANQQGFGAGKAIAGVVVTGGVGLLAGFYNYRKVWITCLKCGHRWRCGD